MRGSWGIGGTMQDERILGDRWTMQDEKILGNKVR